MIIANEGLRITASESRCAGLDPALHWPGSLAKEGWRRSAKPAAGLRRPERDGRDGLNELGLMPAYSSYANREEVADFLAKKNHLVEMLNDLAPYLAEKHGVTDISLKRIACEDYDFDVIMVTPRFHTENIRELIKLQKEINRGFLIRYDMHLTKDLVLAF